MIRKRFARIAILAIVLSLSLFPASAFASSSHASGSGAADSSFFASITSKIAWLFTGKSGGGSKEGQKNHDNGGGHSSSGNSGGGHSSGGHSSGGNSGGGHSGGKGDDWTDGGFWDWLNGGDCGDWWDDIQHDSYSLWKKYYCY